MRVLWDHTLDEVIGDKSGVTGVRIKHVGSGATRQLDVQGVFIAIGHTPNTQLFEGQLDMDERLHHGSRAAARAMRPRPASRAYSLPATWPTMSTGRRSPARAPDAWRRSTPKRISSPPPNFQAGDIVGVEFAHGQALRPQNAARGEARSDTTEAKMPGVPSAAASKREIARTKHASGDVDLAPPSPTSRRCPQATARDWSSRGRPLPPSRACRTRPTRSPQASTDRPHHLRRGRSGRSSKRSKPSGVRGWVPTCSTKLRRGHWSVQDELDLHGLTVDEARDALADYLTDARSHGWRCVRVIHGKGLSSPNREPVLKSKVRRWLTQWDKRARLLRGAAPRRRQRRGHRPAQIVGGSPFVT